MNDEINLIFSIISKEFIFFTVDEKKFIRLADGLLIKNVHRDDSGEYTCTAFQTSHEISEHKQQTIRLNIHR